jgi:hypothetical protein
VNSIALRANTATQPWLPASRLFIFGVQGLMEQHFQVCLVPQPFFRGEGSGSREVIFR